MTGSISASSFQQMLLVTFASGVLAVITAGCFRAIIGRQSTGNEVMQKLAQKIRIGAMAFLTREYRVIVPFILVAAVLIYIFLDTGWNNVGSAWGNPYTALSYIVGAFSSALAGFIGMRTATIANVRTTEAART